MGSAALSEKATSFGIRTLGMLQLPSFCLVRLAAGSKNIKDQHKITMGFKVRFRAKGIGFRA